MRETKTRDQADAGVSLTQSAAKALRERLRHEEGRSRTQRLREELREIRKRCTAPTLLDEETADEIMSLKEDELPH